MTDIEKLAGILLSILELELEHPAVEDIGCSCFRSLAYEKIYKQLKQTFPDIFTIDILK